MGFVKDAKAEGARLVIGGQQPPNMPEGGFFYEPTIFADLNPSVRLAREEVFGPIM
jgi:betaine-aldehyde dehydrogenase